MIKTTQVNGSKNTPKVFLFALSTCGWCRRTREFFESNDVPYEYIYVDLLTGDDRREVLDELAKWTDRRAFPTIVIDENEVLVGLDENKLREALGI